MVFLGFLEQLEHHASCSDIEELFMMEFDDERVIY
jgi:hypothetical protein